MGQPSKARPGRRGAQPRGGPHIVRMTNSDSWIDLVGSSESELQARFGPPEIRRAAEEEVWLIFATGAGRLRVRCRSAASERPGTASWTLTLRDAAGTLAAAAARIGLWPAAAPDVAAKDVTEPLVRRALAASDGVSGPNSLTATVRGGRFTHLSVFDEPPDWV